MNLGLKNKVVVLSGATGGIGKQICLDFLEEGAVLCCLVRSTTKFNELHSELHEPEQLYGFPCDLLDPQAIETTFKHIAERFTRIDILVNVAGYVIERPLSLVETTEIDRMIALNLNSPVYTCRAVLRYMFRQKSGSIVNISSLSAVRKGRGIAVYAAAKGGLETFTRVLAQEVGKKGIRVNCIRPGAVQTGMSSNLQSVLGEKVVSMVALGRFGVPSDISKAVLFAASNEASPYMTGEVITIDGGTD